MPPSQELQPPRQLRLLWPPRSWFEPGLARVGHPSSSTLGSIGLRPSRFIAIVPEQLAVLSRPVGLPTAPRGLVWLLPAQGWLCSF